MPALSPEHKHTLSARATLPLDDTMGEVTLVLYVKVTGEDADFFCRLTDVYPDGRSINLTEGARALALMKGRRYVLTEDMTDLIHDVLRHRLSLTYEALSEGITADAILSKIIGKVAAPLKPMQSTNEAQKAA